MKLYCADCMDILFLSTLSLRRATDYLDLCVKYNIFLSTLSLRRATSERPETLLSYAISIHALLAESDWNTTQLEYNPIISIHALLAESDQPARPRSGTAGKISIHALLAESDIIWQAIRSVSQIFLSTLSLRRATITITITCIAWKFLSTLSLRRATMILMQRFCVSTFLSTLSLRRATSDR